MATESQIPDDGTPVPVIHPNALFTVRSLRKTLRLGKHTVGREIRERRLKASRRAGRYYITGRWVLEWIESGGPTRGRKRLG